jgi:flagellar assembly protein FliH
MSQRSASRFIPGEEVLAVQAWDFGSFGGEQRTQAQLLADEATRLGREESIRQEAHALGYAQGQADGEASAQARFDDYWKQQGEDTARRMSALVDALEKRLSDAEQAVAQAVLTMSCDIARHVVRTELQAQPSHLQTVVAEATTLLVSDARTQRVRLNPADLDALREPLSAAFGERVQWLPDASIEPGGCVVESAGSVVDATLAQRWQRAVARLGLDAPWSPALKETDGD